MRIARFTVGEDPEYGIVQSKDGEEMVYAISGDPLYTQIRPTGAVHRLEDVRLLAPVIPRSKVVGVGRNYAQDASEREATAAEQTLLFLKPNTTVIGPGDPIVLPSYSREVSMEAELAVVIRTLAKDIPPEQADAVILGYTCSNDLTAHDSEQDAMQWVRAKAFDTACPLGPWIETDLDTSALRIRSHVDGELTQDGTTADMVRKIPELVAEISRITTLLPGDVILTGTPLGARAIEAGSRVDIEIEGIGTLSNPAVRR